MTRRLRYLAVGLFLLAPCAARCDDLPTIDNAVLQVLSNTLYVAVTDWEGGEKLVPLFGLHETVLLSDLSSWSTLTIGDKINQMFDLLGLSVLRQPVPISDIWELLEQFGAGEVVWDSDPPYFQPNYNVHLDDIFKNPDFFVACCETYQRRNLEQITGRDYIESAGSFTLASVMLPTFGQALANLANGGGGNGGGGNGGGSGGDQTIHIQIHGGVTNIVRILTNHVNIVSNSLSTVTNSLSVITNSVVVITNQIEFALDYLKQIATNTQQDAIITIMEFMTNNWPDVNISFPDQSNDVQDVTNKLRVGRYTFRADMGPLIIPDRDFGDQSASRKWSYRVDEHGNYYIDGFADDTQYLYGQLDNGEWEFGEVVTYTLQMIADKAQDIKNSLWILNHSIDTNSANVDISELDSYKREVDSFVQGTQSTLESVFYDAGLDDGVFTKFKNNFVAIFGTVGRGPPMLRGASKDGGTRQTIWTFYVGDQRWDISLDSTLYTSSRRLCRMAASMVWCVLLWMGFRKILIRAIYWLVKCIDWTLQVFGFQIKWLGTIEEFLKQVAGIGPGG